MSVQLQNRDLRENYLATVKMLAKANGIAVEQMMTKIDVSDLTQGFVRSPADLTVNTNQILFPISTIDQGSTSGAPNTPITNLVPINNLFVAGMIGYYMMTYSFTGTSQNNIDFTTANMFAPVTYPSAYPNNGASIDWSPGTMLLWLGKLFIEVNDKILIDAWDCSRHLYMPGTQASISGNTFTPGQKNQLDHSTDGFYPVEPMLVFSGSRSNKVQLILPANIPSTISPWNLSGYGTTFIAKAVFHCRGIMAKNASGVK
jgi:hypothetical protein